MATMKAVRLVTEDFLVMVQRQVDDEEVEKLLGLYHSAFHRFSDVQIKKAAELYIQEGDFFPPRPKEIISRIEDRDKPLPRNLKDLQEMYTCKVCRQEVSAVMDGVCLDCKGIPVPAYERAGRLPEAEVQKYRMEGRIRCQECGVVSMCIKDSEDSKWLCRACYTGYSNQEIAEKWRELSRAMKGLKPKYKPPVKAEKPEELVMEPGAVRKRQEELLRQAEILKNRDVDAIPF